MARVPGCASSVIMAEQSGGNRRSAITTRQLCSHCVTCVHPRSSLITQRSTHHVESLRIEQSSAYRRRCDSAHRALNDSRGSAPPLRRLATTARPCAGPPIPPPLPHHHSIVDTCPAGTGERETRDRATCGVRARESERAGWKERSGVERGRARGRARLTCLCAGLVMPRRTAGHGACREGGREPVCGVRTTHTDLVASRGGDAMHAIEHFPERTRPAGGAGRVHSVFDCGQLAIRPRPWPWAWPSRPSRPSRRSCRRAWGLRWRLGSASCG